MNSYERTMNTLSGKIIDRVPVFLFFTFYGAHVMDCSIKEYLDDPHLIAEGQRRLLAKYNHDCLYPFVSAALEANMFGQEIEYYPDGAPNAGEPVIKSREDIFKLTVPDPLRHNGAKNALLAVETLAKEYKQTVPIVSAVIAPFSMPIMLMGMKRWIEMIINNDTEAIRILTEKTTQFCVNWANLLFSAGADAIGFFEPFGSTTIVRREEYIQYIFDTDKAAIAQLKGPAIFCAAGGRIDPIADKIFETGAAGACFSADDDLASIRKAYPDKNILGNLNNVAMVEWDYNKAYQETTKCLCAAGKLEHFILCDQHGEISFQVNDDTLRGIIDAARDYRPRS